MVLDDYLPEKTYDGNNSVLNSLGKPAELTLGIGDYDWSTSILSDGSDISSVLDYDLKYYIKYERSLIYEQKTASDDFIRILASVTMTFKYAGTSFDVVNSIIGSYNIISTPQVDGEFVEYIFNKFIQLYKNVRLIPQTHKFLNLR